MLKWYRPCGNITSKNRYTKHYIHIHNIIFVCFLLCLFVILVLCSYVLVIDVIKLKLSMYLVNKYYSYIFNIFSFVSLFCMFEVSSLIPHCTICIQFNIKIWIRSYCDCGLLFTVSIYKTRQWQEKTKQLVICNLFCFVYFGCSMIGIRWCIDMNDGQWTYAGITELCAMHTVHIAQYLVVCVCVCVLCDCTRLISINNDDEIGKH